MTAEVLADDEEYAEVIQDLHEECGKYGAIRAVHVPRPPNPKVLAASVFGTGTYGKVWWTFCCGGDSYGFCIVAASSVATVHVVVVPCVALVGGLCRIPCMLSTWHRMRALKGCAITRFCVSACA